MRTRTQGRWVHPSPGAERTLDFLLLSLAALSKQRPTMLSRPTTLPRRVLATLGLAALLSSGASAADPEFLTAVQDLPLAPGLLENTESGLAFDKPEGRIVEAFALGDAKLDDVAAFYRATLPALGWKPLVGNGAASRWTRGGEVLSVDIVQPDNPLVVRFAIVPE